MRYVIKNAHVFDTPTLSITDTQQVVVEGGVVRELLPATATVTADHAVDAAGKFLLPGLIDAHVHHVITTMNFDRLRAQSPVELALGMASLAEATVKRGFTTVRDTAGNVTGLVAAIESGLCLGPTIVRSGRALSQTGGHGDWNPHKGTLCACQIKSSELSHIADGPDAVRLAARTELRDGSHFIKIMTSGGVSSPDDPFDSLQYTPEEIRAATTETDHRHTYTTSHAYQPEAIRLAIDNGVRCIEHGNLLDADTAERMVALGVSMVPTLVTYKAMRDIGKEAGLPKVVLDKNQGVFEAGLRSIEIAEQAGVALGFGTDLLGEAQPWQNQEFAIRAEVQSARNMLRSMYHENVRLCGLEGRVGVVAPEAQADLVVSNVNPLDDISALAEPQASLDFIMCRGEVVTNRL